MAPVRCYELRVTRKTAMGNLARTQTLASLSASMKDQENRNGLAAQAATPMANRLRCVLRAFKLNEECKTHINQRHKARTVAASHWVFGHGCAEHETL